VLLRAWANFSDCGFSRRVFLFRQEFSFSRSFRFFPSFCQALAEDRVTTPTKKKKEDHFYASPPANMIAQASLFCVLIIAILMLPMYRANLACSLFEKEMIGHFVRYPGMIMIN